LLFRKIFTYLKIKCVVRRSSSKKYAIKRIYIT